MQQSNPATFVSLVVKSEDNFLYDVKLDHSSRGTWSDEYTVTIKTVTPKDPLAFNHGSVVDTDFIVDLKDKPKITFGATLDKRHNALVSAIGEAYLKYLGN
jgi:hypothetical protein